MPNALALSLLPAEELSKQNSGKLRLFLSKADTAGLEKDRQVRHQCRQVVPEGLMLFLRFTPRKG